MLIIEFDKEVLKKAKNVFRLRGSIKHCAEKTKIDRTTIPRVLRSGTGEERIVKALTKYINSMNAA
jgi:DNA invertase Pin-like site-specific DNA recombinase